MTNMKCPSLSLSIGFRCKSSMLDSRIPTPACFLGPFNWKFFPNPLSESISISEVEVFLYGAD